MCAEKGRGEEEGNHNIILCPNCVCKYFVIINLWSINAKEIGRINQYYVIIN